MNEFFDLQRFAYTLKYTTEYGSYTRTIEGTEIPDNLFYDFYGANKIKTVVIPEGIVTKNDKNIAI